MYQNVCKTCGKLMEFQHRDRIRQFCSKACYGKFLATQKEYEVNIASSNRHYVNPKGFDNLVTAICWQAKKDFLENPPGHWLREDAKRFFLSDEFAQLSQLDGENIVKRLELQYQRKVKRRSVKYGGKCSP